MSEPDPDAPARGEYVIPDGVATRVCRSCAAPIVWITTARGKAIPLSLGRARMLNDGRRVAVSHFADCPDSADWKH